MPTDLKNNHPILGIECPYCGRTCALGTKECPNCHHKLEDPHYTLSNNFQHSQTSAKKSKLLKITAIILVILLMVGMGWLFKNRTITNSVLSPYIYVQINYYDKRKKYYEQIIMLQSKTSLINKLSINSSLVILVKARREKS